MPKTTGNHKLLNIEKNYQKLQYILNTYGSDRIKLEHLQLFLYKLVRDKNNSMYFSYFDELIREYISLITASNLEYRSINVLESLRMIGKTFIDHKIKETKSTEFINSQAITSNQIVLTYIYLGEWYKGLRVFFPNLKQNDFKKVYSILQQDLSNASESTTLQNYVHALGKDTLKNNKDVKTVLNTLESWEDVFTNSQDGKTWVLLVEHESQDAFVNNNKNEDIIAIGNIQQLNTNSHKLPSDSAQDFVVFNNLSLSYNDLLYQQANTAIKVAKDNLGKSISKSNNKYNVIYSFLNKGYYYSGESLGLAMTISAISNISNNNDYKNKYTLLQDYCITGSVNVDGTVDAISDKALTRKLDTVFYSPFKKVLVPQGNKNHAVAQLNKFKKEYLHRDLEIITVYDIQNTILNHKITLHDKISLQQRFKQKNKHWYPITISILLMLTITYLVFPSSIDKNPVALKVGISNIEVYNIAGEKLWHYDFGYQLDAKKYQYPDNLLPLYVFDDLNDDGLNELVIGKQYSEIIKNMSGGLYVFSSNGKLLWKYDQHPVMTFGEEKFDDIYYVTTVRTHTFNGIKKIFVSFAKYMWYPSRLVAFDIKGEILGEYWNSGYAHVKQFFDIDEDGVDEIILGGGNNDYNKGIIAILEHDRIEGHSPQLNKAYIPKGIPIGMEKYYIKFPDPEDFFVNTRRGNVTQIDALDDQIIVRESLDHDDHFFAYYILNKNLEIAKFGLSDPYIAAYKNRTGRNLLIDYPPPKLKELFDKLEFWNGENFVSKPVMSNQN